MIGKRLISNWEHYKGSLGGPWEVWRGDKLANHYNVPWHEVELPHCYNALDCVDPDTIYYQGPGWYRTKLDVENPYSNGRTLLHFEGAGQKTEVYVYTWKVSSHIGGYDEFIVDITDMVDRAKEIERYKGKIPIAVMCDNSRDLEMSPSDISDFNLYGGIYRYLNLVYVPAISIDYVHIETREISENSAQLFIKSKLYNPEELNEELDLEILIIGPDGRQLENVSFSSTPWEGEKEIGRFTVEEPKLWFPDSPNLYTCKVKLNTSSGQTEKAERFGIRFFEFVKNGPFMLNGERLLIKGTQRHEDHAGVGAAMNEELIEKEMKLIKDMGANFVRLGHYQQSRIVLDLCDELGLLVWEEIPWCRGGLGGDRYKNQLRNMLKNMINQHFNHPSIIIWGLGNENDWEGDFDYFDKDAIREFMTELNEIAHGLDKSRVTGIRRCEFCKDIVDVYSPSIWAGWYRGIYKEYEKYTREEFEDTDRFIHMEWGADNIAGRHAEKPYTGFDDIAVDQGAAEQDGDYLLEGGQARVSRDGDWSETYFCDLADWYLKCQEKMDWLTGTAQWIFKDFSTPVRPENPIPYVNAKGIVQRDLTLKESYYVFQSYWAEKPMVHIYGHNMPIRWGDEGEIKIIKVYSNCLTAELFLNGQSLGVKERNAQDFPAAGLRWEAILKKGTNRLKVIGKKDGVEVQDDLEIYYQTDSWGKVSNLELSYIEKKDGMFMVEVKAYDENDIFCADASNFVRFEIAGDGKLLDNLGTVNGSRYIQLINGRARIMVELPQGECVVSVSSSSLQTKFIRLKY